MNEVINQLIACTNMAIDFCRLRFDYFEKLYNAGEMTKEEYLNALKSANDEAENNLRMVQNMLDTIQQI